MASVSESSVARLGGTFVLSHLQSQVSLAGPQLLLGEGALVLIGHLGSQPGASVLGVQLGLKERGESVIPAQGSLHVHLLTTRPKECRHRVT